MFRKVAIVTIAVSMAGCGRESFKLAPVSGSVAFEGKPLAKVHVTFMPLSSDENPNPGPGSRALTDSEGRFVMTTTTGRKGAVVGKHRVAIEAEQGGAASNAEQSDGAESEDVMRKRVETSLNAIPARYNHQSTLSIDVPSEGLTDAHFELTK